MNINKVILMFFIGCLMGGIVVWCYLELISTDNKTLEIVKADRPSAKPVLKNETECPEFKLAAQERPGRVLLEKNENVKKENGRAVFFLPEVEFIETESYADFISQLSSESIALYAKLNDSFNNAFEFANERELELALANGFPTPEELEYVYSQEIEELIASIRNQKAKIKFLTDPGYPKIEKLATLTFNRAMDEFVEVVRQYNANYREGDPLPEYQYSEVGLLSADQKELSDRVVDLRILAHGNLASTYLASARFNNLNIYNYKKEEVSIKRLAELAVAQIKLQNDNISENLWPSRKNVPSEFIALRAALTYVDMPNCN